jgi:hypothetical protein
MKKYTVTRFDRYNVLTSDQVVVESSNIKNGFQLGYLGIFDDMDITEEDVPVDDLKINEKETQAGIDFDEESWLVVLLK